MASLTILAAFSAEGRGVHFELEQTLCQQPLKYISMYNTEGGLFCSEKKKMFLSD